MNQAEQLAVTAPIPLAGTGGAAADPRFGFTDPQQLDAARQHAAKVKARVRPWRPILALVLAELAATISRSARTAAASPAIPQTAFGALGHTGTEALADAAAVTFSLCAGLATVGLAAKAREVLQPKIGIAHAAVVRYAIALLGGLATILITLQLLGIAVTQLLLGGVLASVLIGIAAQQSLSSVFAGLVLLLARPVDVGDQVLIRSGALGGELRGTVTEIGVTYVRLDTADGPLHLPNSQVLGAAIAPVHNITPARPASGREPDRTGGPPDDTGNHTAERATSASAGLGLDSCRPVVSQVAQLTAIRTRAVRFILDV